MSYSIAPWLSSTSSYVLSQHSAVDFEWTQWPVWFWSMTPRLSVWCSLYSRNITLTASLLSKLSSSVLDSHRHSVEWSSLELLLKLYFEAMLTQYCSGFFLQQQGRHVLVGSIPTRPSYVRKSSIETHGNEKGNVPLFLLNQSNKGIKVSHLA